ncbi:hypothetical protein Clacol_003087 [Clathrus columnatus]|uniref:Peptidase S1 domain-containing protein n=1 Tax=Clathrus columnatus TaxID=1419009 RepID=A0AAV5A2K4_9AGAM|nr:hypothetical protein Clacol_003087 [Clathrus columnatus]
MSASFQATTPMDEAHNDFYGIPSNPLSIYHTGPRWPLPGPQAQRIPKETRPVYGHPISHVWRELGKKIYMYFDSIELKWTSIDPVRFAEVGKEPGPVFLWVGVLPDTLSSDHAKDVAAYCKEILVEYGFADVEIAFRESIYTRHVGSKHVGPKLLDHVHSSDPTVDLSIPFTPALSLQISPLAFPRIGGTGCLYLREGGQSERVFLLTARHIVFPPDKYPNDLYRLEKSQTRREIVHLGEGAFDKAFDAITRRIQYWDNIVNNYQATYTDLKSRVKGKNAETTSDEQALEESRLNLKWAEASRSTIVNFQRNINSSWRELNQRILGHVLYSPPISVVSIGDILFTEDWALIELNNQKFNWETFRGNVIHLGSKLEPAEFKRKIYPHALTQANFEYPKDHLMQLRDFVKYHEFSMLDASGDPCFIVIKNGATTGVTLGRISELESFVRQYNDYGIDMMSTEVAVHPYSHNDSAFSAGGDSGSVVVDANHRIIGMITGGANTQTESTDITYVTAYSILNERIKEAFPHSHLYPIPKAVPTGSPSKQKKKHTSSHK